MYIDVRRGAVLTWSSSDRASRGSWPRSRTHLAKKPITASSVATPSLWPTRLPYWSGYGSDFVSQGLCVVDSIFGVTWIVHPCEAVALRQFRASQVAWVWDSKFDQNTVGKRIRARPRRLRHLTARLAR